MKTLQNLKSGSDIGIEPADPRQVVQLHLIWEKAFRDRTTSPYEICQNMSNSTYLGEKLVHLLVAKSAGEVRGWLSMLELTTLDRSQTGANVPGQWHKELSCLRQSTLQELRALYGFEPLESNPTKTPDEVLAHVMLSHLFDSKPNLETGPVLLLDTSVVDPEYHGQGIGTAMLRETCQIAKRHKVWIVTLVPQLARDVFESIGFKKIGRFKITWSENYVDGDGKSKYFAMAFDPDQKIEESLYTIEEEEKQQ